MVLAVLAIIAGVYYFGTYKNKTTPIVSTSSPIASVQPSSSPVAILTPDPVTANWKTYTSNNFSFKYPNNWTQSQNGLTSNIENKYSKYGEADKFYWMYVNIDNFSYLTLSNKQNFFIDKKSDIIDGIVNGYKTHSYFSCMETCGYTTYIEGYNKTINFFIGSFDQAHTDTQIMKIYDQILSTFKFTK